MLTSTRRSIIYPNPNRADTADVPRDFLAVIAALEIDVVYGQGTLAARPAFGLQGRMYCASDQTPKQFFWDNGTGWDPIGALVAGSIRGSTTGDVQQEILQGSVRRVDLSTQLKPSGTAVAADEALRALGTTANTAAAGNDARLSDTRVPTDGSVTAAKLAAGAAAGQSYGTAFPTTGLYNGYRFTFFHTDVTGTVPIDYIYRADLNGTKPWHSIDSKDLLMISNTDFGFNTVAASWQTLSSPVIARQGDYILVMSWTGGTNDTNAGAPASSIRLTGPAAYVGNARQVMTNLGSNGHIPTGGSEVTYLSGVAAAAAANVQGQVSLASNGTVEGLSLVAIPVRVI